MANQPASVTPLERKVSTASSIEGYQRVDESV
jgi:hypothetical protein